jgi:hypothetical protein
VRGCQTLLDDVAGQLDAAGVEGRTPLKSHTSAGDVCDLKTKCILLIHSFS